MTPAPIARFMASLFTNFAGEVALLDPGAGVGSLTSAFVERAIRPEAGCRSLLVHTYELDSALKPHLAATLADCAQSSRTADVRFDWAIFTDDFVEAGAHQLLEDDTLFAVSRQRYSHCIMNPPYRKISNNSE